jgi:hypothetical protein
MYSPEQSHNPVYLRLETIDRAIDLLEQAFNQQQSVELVVSAPVSNTEPEPEIYINNVESARRVVDRAYGVSTTTVAEAYPVLTDTVDKTNHNEVSSTDINLEELFKEANGVNR